MISFHAEVLQDTVRSRMEPRFSWLDADEYGVDAEEEYE